MGPQPLRGPTKKQQAEKPEALKANFLLQISQQLASSHPQLASIYTRNSLKLADATGIHLPHGAQHQVCERCGSSALAGTSSVVSSGELPKVERTSKSFKRRQALKVKAGKTSGNKTIHEAVLLRPCAACGHVNVRLYATMKQAEDALAQLRQQQQQGHQGGGAAKQVQTPAPAVRPAAGAGPGARGPMS